MLHANRVVSRDRLIDELWNGAPPDTAATALQVHVSQMRKTLGRDTIVTRTPGYMLAVEPGAVDVERFQGLVDEARSQEPREAATTLRRALDLWRGPLLADVDGSVARTERAQLEEQQAEALELRVEADLALGSHLELVSELERLLREEPLRERRRAQLMLALYRSGRQAEALEVYRQGRRLLTDELGLEPGQELRELEKSILEHDPSLAAPAGSRPSPGAQRAEEHRRRLLAGSRWALVVGAVLLAGALAAALVLLTRGSDASVAVIADSVAVVDPGSGRVRADVSIGGRPVGIAVGAGSVWVVNGDDETVLRIDPKTHRVVKTIGGLGTDLSAIAFGFGSVWVAGGNDGTVVRIDPRLNAAEAPVELGPTGALLPHPVFSIAVGEGGVWVTRGNRVLRIDPRTNAVAASVRAVRVLGLAAGAGSVWAPQTNEELLRLDPQSAAVTASSNLSVETDSPLVYAGSLWLVAFTQQPQIWRFAPGTLEQVDAIALPSGFPFGLTSMNSSLWTIDHDHGTVLRIDPQAGRATMLVKVGHHPVALASGEGALWVGVQVDQIG